MTHPNSLPPLIPYRLGETMSHNAEEPAYSVLSSARGQHHVIRVSSYQRLSSLMIRDPETQNFLWEVSFLWIGRVES